MDSHCHNSANLECEMTRLISATHMTCNGKTTAIGEVRVMPLTVEKMNFITA